MGSSCTATLKMVNGWDPPVQILCLQINSRISCDIETKSCVCRKQKWTGHRIRRCWSIGCQCAVGYTLYTDKLLLSIGKDERSTKLIAIKYLHIRLKDSTMLFREIKIRLDISFLLSRVCGQVRWLSTSESDSDSTDNNLIEGHVDFKKFVIVLFLFWFIWRYFI